MRLLLTATLAACLSFAVSPGSVRAAPPPTGMAGLLVGIGLISVGTFTTGAAFSICTSGISSELVPSCAIPIATVGVAALTSGIVGLSLGIKRRRAYNAWRREYGPTATLVPTFSHDGAGIRLAARY